MEPRFVEIAPGIKVPVDALKRLDRARKAPEETLGLTKPDPYTTLCPDRKYRHQSLCPYYDDNGSCHFSAFMKRKCGEPGELDREALKEAFGDT